MNIPETTGELQSLDIVLRQIKQTVETDRGNYQHIAEGLSGKITTADIDIIDRVAQIRQCILEALNELQGHYETDPETGNKYCISPPMPEDDSEQFVLDIIAENRPKIETLLTRIGAMPEEEIPDTLPSSQIKNDK